MAAHLRVDRVLVALPDRTTRIVPARFAAIAGANLVLLGPDPGGLSMWAEPLAGGAPIGGALLGPGPRRRRLALSGAQPGFLAWKKNIGVKMPDSPPRTRASAPRFKKSLTTVEPLGATRTDSSTRTSLPVSQRPGGVRFQPEGDHWPASG